MSSSGHDSGSSLSIPGPRAPLVLATAASRMGGEPFLTPRDAYWTSLGQPDTQLPISWWRKKYKSHQLGMWFLQDGERQRKSKIIRRNTRFSYLRPKDSKRHQLDVRTLQPTFEFELDSRPSTDWELSLLCVKSIWSPLQKTPTAGISFTGWSPTLEAVDSLVQSWVYFGPWTALLSEEVRARHTSNWKDLVTVLYIWALYLLSHLGFSVLFWRKKKKDENFLGRMGEMVNMEFEEGVFLPTSVQRFPKSLV